MKITFLVTPLAYWILHFTFFSYFAVYCCWRMHILINNILCTLLESYFLVSARIYHCLFDNVGSNKESILVLIYIWHCEQINKLLHLLNQTRNHYVVRAFPMQRSTSRCKYTSVRHLDALHRAWGKTHVNFSFSVSMEFNVPLLIIKFSAKSVFVLFFQTTSAGMMIILYGF